MSLAGAQTKLAVALNEAGCISIPMNGSPSTHILKPDVPRLCSSVHNEAFSLTLARRIKLATPNITTGWAGNRIYLPAQTIRPKVPSAAAGVACTRRTIVRRLGGRDRAKYESNKTGIDGPTLKEMFALHGGNCLRQRSCVCSIW